MRNAHLATPLNSRNHDVYGYGKAPIVDPNLKVVDRSADEAAVAAMIVATFGPESELLDMLNLRSAVTA